MASPGPRASNGRCLEIQWAGVEGDAPLADLEHLQDVVEAGDHAIDGALTGRESLTLCGRRHTQVPLEQGLDVAPEEGEGRAHLV